MDKNSLINYEKLAGFDKKMFYEKETFPFASFYELLTPKSFQQLISNFPDIEKFKKNENLTRKYNQRPHNRYYLSYKKSTETSDNLPGFIKHQELSKSWQQFIDELENKQYKQYIKKILGVSTFNVKYVWHIGINGSEVSPHCDVEDKLGTHIFYFNTSQDWQEEWGGATVILDQKQISALNPDFSDFKTKIPIPFLDNHSFLFKNAPEFWHGVERLSCPEGKQRRIFSVIFESASLSKVIKKKLSWLLHKTT